MVPYMFAHEDTSKMHIVCFQSTLQLDSYGWKFDKVHGYDMAMFTGQKGSRPIQEGSANMGKKHSFRSTQRIFIKILV